MDQMSLLTSHHQQLHRAAWSKPQARANDRARALLGQFARFALVLTGACGLLTLMVILKTTACLSHHPM